MIDFATAALGFWFVVSVVLLPVLGARRAILVAIIGGALFLPLVSIPVPGPIPALTKTSTVMAGVLLGMLLFDRRAFLRVRPSWFDTPMVVWVVSPMLSSVANRLGVYDGLSAVLDNLLAWGIPYWLGRVYFFETDALNDLAWGIFIGGLLYIPLCWFEILQGPYLHFYVYGIYPDAAVEAFRFGGWRPIVFMDHGLMVALWMSAASVSGVVLLLGGQLVRGGRWLGMGAVGVLVITTIALKSVNAWILVPFVIVLVLISVRRHTPRFMWGITGVIFTYLGLRTIGRWYAFELAELVNLVLPGKKESVLFRLVNEVQIIERAWLQPLWGWGRWGRAFIGRPGGLPRLIPDSLWIGALGQQGFIGFAAILGVLFLPSFLFTRRVPPTDWLTAKFAAVTACVCVTLVFALDSLANAMMLPVYLLAAGGILGWCIAFDRAGAPV